MDQVKIGIFLKQLRKDRNLSQEQLAQTFNVSNRTISRWETGINLPDVSLLTEIASFYNISVDDILQGQISNNINDSNKTIIRVAEYSENKMKNKIFLAVGIIINILSLILIISGFVMFPSESSWSSIFAFLGVIGIIISIFIFCKIFNLKFVYALISSILCLIAFFMIFSLSDYLAVKYFNQVPRFRISTTYDSRYPNDLYYKTIFYDVVCKNVGTENEIIQIIK